TLSIQGLTPCPILKYYPVRRRGLPCQRRDLPVRIWAKRRSSGPLPRALGPQSCRRHRSIVIAAIDRLIEGDHRSRHHAAVLGGHPKHRPRHLLRVEHTTEGLGGGGAVDEV